MSPTLSNGYSVSRQVLTPADLSGLREARRAVPISAGDVLMLDRFAPHRSLPVRAGHVRWAVVMWVTAVATESET